MILLFFGIYIIIDFVKEFTLQKFFYITPYLIIYTPLETPGSSPTGCFSVKKKKKAWKARKKRTEGLKKEIAQDRHSA